MRMHHTPLSGRTVILHPLPCSAPRPLPTPCLLLTWRNMLLTIVHALLQTCSLMPFHPHASLPWLESELPGQRRCLSKAYHHPYGGTATTRDLWMLCNSDLCPYRMVFVSALTSGLPSLTASYYCQLITTAIKWWSSWRRFPENPTKCRHHCGACGRLLSC